MFAYAIQDRDHERLLHDLDFLAQSTPSKPVRKPARGRLLTRRPQRSIRVAAAH